MSENKRRSKSAASIDKSGDLEHSEGVKKRESFIDDLINKSGMSGNKDNRNKSLKSLEKKEHESDEDEDEEPFMELAEVGNSGGIMNVTLSDH